MRRGGRALLAVLAAAACQGTPPPSAPPAEVSIEILGGFAHQARVRPPEPERVEVLVDVTSSLRAGPDGAEHYRAARSAAARFLDALPKETGLGVRALGLRSGRKCASAIRLGGDRRQLTRAELGRRVETLRPAGEGSLAVALAELRGSLATSGDLTRSRVVVFSDLGSECGGDLCDAAAMLLADGTRLDFVVVGDGATPACFDSLVPKETPLEESLLQVPPVFRIVAYDPGPEREPFLLAEGRADGTRRRVPAGPVTVLIGFDPPSLIGPMVLSPGTWTHIRVVEFPSLDPPVREWVWATFPLAPGVWSPP